MESKNVETLMQVIASISCCCSLFIILIFLKFPELQKYELSRLVNMICFCDFFGSLGMAFGHPEDGSIQCVIQAILTNIFPIAGVLWTTLISWLLLIHVFKLRSIDRFSWQITFLCFFLPLFVTFLPLTTEQFGLQNTESGWCFLKDRPHSPSWTLLFWTAVSFYLWMWGAMIIYLILFTCVAYETYRIFSRNPNASNRKTFYRIFVYFIFPLNVFLSWLPATLYDFLRTSGHGSYSGHELLEVLSDIFPTFLGMANAVTFIAINEQMRMTVLSLLTGRTPEDYDDDEPIRVVFQEEEQRQRESEMVGQSQSQIKRDAGDEEGQGGDDEEK
jgi:hypothetical protein